MISVCITVHRRPGYLLQSAGSVIAQTYKDWELLIGYNSNEPEAADIRETAYALAHLDSRIGVFNCRGCTNGFDKLQYLLTRAQGSWAALIDYDDLWYPNRLAAQAPLMDQYDVISAQAIYFGMEDGRRIPTPKGDLRPAHFARSNPVVCPTVLTHTEYLRWLDPAYKFGPHDYKLWVDLINEGKRFHALPEVLALHRLAPDSAYNAHMDQNIVAQIGRMVK
jgi:glycosyltransferase involved in cell wall biosynthesis